MNICIFYKIKSQYNYAFTKHIPFLAIKYILQNIHNLWTIKIYLTKYTQSLDYKNISYKLKHSRRVQF